MAKEVLNIDNPIPKAEMRRKRRQGMVNVKWRESKVYRKFKGFDGSAQSNTTKRLRDKKWKDSHKGKDYCVKGEAKPSSKKNNEKWKKGMRMEGTKPRGGRGCRYISWWLKKSQVSRYGNWEPGRQETESPSLRHWNPWRAPLGLRTWNFDSSWAVVSQTLIIAEEGKPVDDVQYNTWVS